MYFVTEEAASRCLKAFEAICPVSESWVHECTPVFFTGKQIKHVHDLNKCNNCGKKGGRVFMEEGNAHCNYCGSSDLLRTQDMKPKEVLKHVRNYLKEAA